MPALERTGVAIPKRERLSAPATRGRLESGGRIENERKRRVCYQGGLSTEDLKWIGPYRVIRTYQR